MKKRKYRSKGNNPDLLLGLFLVSGLFLYAIGATAKDIVMLLMLATFIIVVAYLFIISLRGAWYDGRWVFNFIKTRNIKDVDSMTGLQFERYVAKMLKNRGCKNVRLTEHYDLGVDIIAQKDGVTWGIQTKRYSGLVGVDAVRQVVAALKQYDCDRSMVITNSPEGYSRPARQLAKDNSCILIGRDRLSKWINEYEHKATAVEVLE
jgi:HJR/Mrr/RecB family endonuclease